MFEIDKKKFGAFVSELRKEKGYTQKDLAQKLFISDKAVSKWETGVSIPDTALLVPLADLLGVTVTELLMCERMEKEEPITADQVESIVKTAITYPDGKAARAYQGKSWWTVLYFFCAAVGIIGTLFCYARQFRCDAMLTAVILGAVFGAYFCFFVKTKLPTFYDENKCGLYYDGPFRMNVPGVAFNNSNWPYIVRVGRIWSCLSVALYP
ncbi:MAG: helix-turn-helix transcriptional regulator, partial [Clostridiales bacterium]|nr:helix-turn-helix transcriptional regulator [Clostridiales bacterium]